jgi:hypothetical protein
MDDANITRTHDITSALRDTSKKTYTVIVVRNKKEMPITVTIDRPERPRRAFFLPAFPV